MSSYFCTRQQELPEGHVSSELPIPQRSVWMRLLCSSSLPLLGLWLCLARLQLLLSSTAFLEGPVALASPRPLSSLCLADLWPAKVANVEFMKRDSGSNLDWVSGPLPQQLTCFSTWSPRKPSESRGFRALLPFLCAHVHTLNRPLALVFVVRSLDSFSTGTLGPISTGL